MKHCGLLAILGFISVFMLFLGVFFIFQPKNSIGLLVQDDAGLLLETTDCTIQTAVSYSAEYSPYRVMDIYLPEGEGPFPALIYIHGGGWVTGSRSNYADLATFYAKRGIAGFAIDYTLSTGNNTAWPENIQDVVEAIRYIKEYADQFHVDPQRLGALGNSAGAQLASLAGTLEGTEPFLLGSSGNEKIRSQICLVVDYAGATDLEYVGRYANRSVIYFIVRNALGNVSYQENPDLWIEASPATYISGDDPVFCLVHGTNDTVIPISVAESFYNKFIAAGNEAHLIIVPDGDHDILTSETTNLIVRYTLEPIMVEVFTPQPSHLLTYLSLVFFMLAAVFGLAASLLFSITYRKTP
jgi:acetyl esterase/lipase